MERHTSTTVSDTFTIMLAGKERDKGAVRTLGDGRTENVESILSGYSCTYSYEGSRYRGKDEHNFSEF